MCQAHSVQEKTHTTQRELVMAELWEEKLYIKGFGVLAQ
jgi:hypothetical protein